MYLLETNTLISVACIAILPPVQHPIDRVAPLGQARSSDPIAQLISGHNEARGGKKLHR